jgi:hypothetical protein
MASPIVMNQHRDTQSKSKDLQRKLLVRVLRCPSAHATI